MIAVDRSKPSKHGGWLGRHLREIRARRRQRALFDAGWYLEQNEDVAAAGVDPFAHYLEHGWREQRAPHPLFSTSWYLSRNEDVLSARLEPLRHYLMHGWREGRSPHPLFDVGWYLSQNPDVAASGAEPLLHYLKRGWREARAPHPLFDVARYLERYPDVAAAGREPLSHYLQMGWREGRDPCAFFFPAWYRSQNPDVMSADTEPFSHYLATGWRKGRAPHPLFDVEWYLDRNKDVAMAGKEPLAHYVTSGWLEKRQPSAVYSRVAPRALEVAGSAGVRHPVEDVFEYFRSHRELLEAETWAMHENHPVTRLRYELIGCRNDFRGKNVCLFACHCPDGRMDPTTNLMLRWIRNSGFSVVCIVANGSTVSFEYPGDDPDLCFIVRDNVGYDFAGWALALSVLPTLWLANAVLFANDSVFGPVDSPTNGLIRDSLASPADCVALTASQQESLHFQSYFFLVKRKVLESSHFRAFWAAVRVVNDQRRIIMQYEIKLLSVVIMSGASCHVVFQSLCDNYADPINPTLYHWRELIDAGFPFLKKRVVTDDLEVVDRKGWLDVIQNPELRKHLMTHLTRGEQDAPSASLLRTRSVHSRRQNASAATGY
ncbi:rhamnan synthesis F family protein [Reyranella sp. CPCC 100927]|uniref:rhamnan synthesis F family protein n=1 Tax=Reyranella sp. CPCC 100927 TaxID=2599616 RepID=UPI0015B579DF|nr:rhamnan synthesis F family protein [Reyranella sp. CPCC 100927]